MGRGPVPLLLVKALGQGREGAPARVHRLPAGRVQRDALGDANPATLSISCDGTRF
jgi:hypothetical protein